VRPHSAAAVSALKRLGDFVWGAFGYCLFVSKALGKRLIELPKNASPRFDPVTFLSSVVFEESYIRSKTRGCVFE
jgi:hypothetical protein